MEMCEAAKRILDTPAKVVYYRAPGDTSGKIESDADHDDYEKVETTAWGTMTRDDFYNALASSCAQQIIDHHDSVKNSSEAIAWFMLMVRSYGSQYLAEKYAEMEEAEDGSTEN